MHSGAYACATHADAAEADQHPTCWLPCVDPCPLPLALQVLVSGGLDHDLLLWPYLSQSPSGALKGSLCATVQLEPGPSPSQVLALGTDSVVRLWDVRKMRIVQVVNPTHGLGTSESTDIRAIEWTQGAAGSLQQQPISAICFDEGCLVTGHQHLTKWRSAEATSAGAGDSAGDTKAWREPDAAATLVTFSSDFEIAVTAHQGSLLSAWKVETGELSVRMREAHGASEVTSLAVVPGRPRVVSGAHDGGIKLWSFATGQCLKRFSSPADYPNGAEVTGLAPLELKGSHHLLSVGWSRALSVWTDTAASGAAGVAVQPGVGAPSVERSRALEEHSSDALCLAENGAGLLASGDCDGVVVVWDIDMTCHDPALVTNSIAPRRRLRLPATPSSADPPTPADILCGLADRAGAPSAALSGDGRVTVSEGTPKRASLGASAPSRSPPSRRPSERLPLRPRRPAASGGAYHGVEKLLFLRQIKARPLMAAYSDGTVAAWNVGSGDIMLRSVSGHDDREAIVGLLTDTENRLLISASAGGVVCVRSTAALVDVVARGRKSLALQFRLVGRTALATTTGTAAVPLSRGLAAAAGLGMLRKQEEHMLPQNAPSDFETIHVWRSSQGVIASADYVDKWALLLLAPGATTCWTALRLYTLRGEPVAAFGAMAPNAAVFDVAGKLDAIRRAREDSPPAGEVGIHPLLDPLDRGKLRTCGSGTAAPAAEASGFSVQNRTRPALAGAPGEEELVTAQQEAGRARAHAAEPVPGRAAVRELSEQADDESGAGSGADSPGRDEDGRAYRKLHQLLEGYGLGTHDYCKVLSEHAERLDSHLLRANAQKAASAAEREAAQDVDTLAQDGESRQWLQRMTVRGGEGSQYSRAELALLAVSRSEIAAATSWAAEGRDAATSDGKLRHEGVIVPAQTTAVHGHLLVRALRDVPLVEKPDERRARLYGTAGACGRAGYLATVTRVAKPAASLPAQFARSRSSVSRQREATTTSSSGSALLGAARKLEDALNRMNRPSAPPLRQMGTMPTAAGGGRQHSSQSRKGLSYKMPAAAPMKRSNTSPSLKK